MKFRISLLRLLIGIPLIWLISTIIFLQFTSLVHRSSDFSSATLVNLPIVVNGSRFGENGTAVEIDALKLALNDRRRYEDGFHHHAFNAYVSDMISINRSLPDIRDPACRNIQYKARPITASIIMCFHNELWSVLLRSVHSILNRTPSHLLKEIILVDDFSSPGPLRSPLDLYMNQLKIVKIVRQNQREGLIRSRIAGAAVAQGDALVFLDSHIEVTDGWLEPLLDPISQNSTIVVTPIIDIIDDNTFKYSTVLNKHVSVGGFDWNLQFNWHALPDRDKRRRENDWEPARSPTMAGGLFAIDRQYFDYLGKYDDGMDIWGGENIEMSFRIWMCGGTLLTAPCSHVGHIFRKRSPYKWIPGVNIVQRNTVRVAEVWLDQFKDFYYERINFQLGAFGDVSSRIALRERLKCKSFAWYLKEVYPEQEIPNDVLKAGEVKNQATTACLDANTDHRSLNKPAAAYPCHLQGGNQFFTLTNLGEIRRDDGCLDFAPMSINIDKDDRVIVARCHGQKGNQQWAYNGKNQIRHLVSNWCLTLSKDRIHVKMIECDENQLEQQWHWQSRTWNSSSTIV